jgi:hypothetical protein
VINQHMPLKSRERRRKPRVGYTTLMRSWWVEYNTYGNRESLKKFANRARAFDVNVFDS